MNDILFEILKAAIILILILISRYGIPYLKQELENTKHDWIIKWIGIMVESTEQTVFGDKKGAERKAIVVKFIKSMLIKKNINLTDEQLDSLIEAAVYEMKRG